MTAWRIPGRAPPYVSSSHGTDRSSTRLTTRATRPSPDHKTVLDNLIHLTLGVLGIFVGFLLKERREPAR